MRSVRNNPDSEENQRATRENESYAGGLRLQDSFEMNHRAFVNRLKSVGWSDEEAEQEWENIQNDEES